MRKITLLSLVVMGVLISACGPSAMPAMPATPATPTPEPTIGLPNPASVYCQEQGGKLEIRADSQGNQYGVCILPGGAECEEWAFFRGLCDKGVHTCGEGATLAECPRGGFPVCGRLEIGTQAPYDVEYRTYDNPCLACASSTKTEVLVSYTLGECG